MLAIAVSDKRTFGPPGLAWGYVAVNLVLAILMVWGGIAALRGRTNKILVYTALALAALQTSDGFKCQVVGRSPVSTSASRWGGAVRYRRYFSPRDVMTKWFAE